MKNASKVFGIIALIVIIMVSFSGCVSMVMGKAMEKAKSQYKNYGVFDKSVPADQQSELRFMFVNVKSFNGQSVSWGDKANNQGFIKVPSGINTVVFDWVQEITKLTSIDYNSVKGETTYTYTTTTQDLNNIIFSDVKMLPGHNYLIGGGKGSDGRLRIWLLDQTSTPCGYYGDIVAKPPEAVKTPTKLEGTWKNTYGETFEFAGNTWIQTLPPMTRSNTGPNHVRMRGTFVDSDGTFTLYTTDTSIDGGKWFDLRAMEQSFIYKYSFEGNNLLLELPWVFPETAYVKQ